MHFVVLARVWKEVSLTWLGWALTGCGVVGLVLVLTHRSSASIAVAAGIIPGAILLAGSFWGAGPNERANFEGAGLSRDSTRVACQLTVAVEMVSGMADSRKVTFTLPLATPRSSAPDRRDRSGGACSGFVQHSVAVALDDIAGWSAALSEALANTGGELSAQESA